jgi:hypothetical protein
MIPGTKVGRRVQQQQQQQRLSEPIIQSKYPQLEEAKRKVRNLYNQILLPALTAKPGPLAPQAGIVPPVGSTARNDGPLDEVAVSNFAGQLQQSPRYEKKRLMHSLVSKLLEADADILRDILGPASQAPSNRPPKRSHPPVDPEGLQHCGAVFMMKSSLILLDKSPKRQKQVNDVHGRNGNRESQSMSPSTNEESPTSPGFVDIPLFQDAGDCSPMMDNRQVLILLQANIRNCRSLPT